MADVQGILGQISGCPDPFQHRFLFAEKFIGFCKQDFSGAGQLQRVFSAVKKGYAQFCFQLPQLFAEGRLADIKFSGAVGDAAGLDGSPENGSG